MSRSISVWYSQNGKEVSVDIGQHELLGTQGFSMKFWSTRKLVELGLRQLNVLGHTDPVLFKGWEELLT